MTDSGRIEDRVDLSHETNALIQQTSEMSSDSSANLSDILNLLYALEKKCRVGNDTSSLVKICEHTLSIAKKLGKSLDETLECLNTLCTRRSQKSKAVTALVQAALPWIEECSNADDKLSLVVALRNITDGKILLEAERARLTLQLSKMKEEAGEVGAAADILQEVHVETYGALSKREKIEFLLEQMRVTLLKQDFVRAAIVSNKINRKVLSEEGMEEHRVRFFSLMTEYHRHEKDAYNLAVDYHTIYKTNSDLDALKATIVFLALSPFDMEQQDMLNRISADENIERLDAYHSMIKMLLKKEIINYPTPQQVELESIEAFNIGVAGLDLTSHWHAIFHTRLIQHNIRVAAAYYRRIHGSRLAELLSLDTDRLEKEISAMVSDGSVYAKIDRPKDIIRFSTPKSAEVVLSDWTSDISELLGLVDSTSHLIHQEIMTRAVS